MASHPAAPRLSGPRAEEEDAPPAAAGAPDLAATSRSVLASAEFLQLAQAPARAAQQP